MTQKYLINKTFKKYQSVKLTGIIPKPPQEAATMRVSLCETPNGLVLKRFRLRYFYKELILIVEPLLLAVNALPKSLLIPTKTRILRWFGYFTYAYILKCSNYFYSIAYFRAVNITNRIGVTYYKINNCLIGI